MDANQALGAASTHIDAAGAQETNQDVGRQLPLVRWNATFRPRDQFAQTLHQCGASLRLVPLAEHERL